MSASTPISLKGEAAWRDAARRLAAGEADLVSLWGDEGRMRMALRESNGALAVVDVACEGGAFPSVAALHPPASRLERSACDLFGFAAIGAPDDRRWLDHGRWPLRHPLGRAEPHDGAPDPYPFLKAEGPGLHQIPVGPVHAGIIEPGHFRFHAGGEAVVRLEERLGYVHKGVDALMRGASVERAARSGGAGQRRLDGRLWRRLRPRGRGGARDRGAGARARSSRRDGRARADRQSPRRRRRDLQRRGLRPDARPLRRSCASGPCAPPRPPSAIG